MTCEQEIVSSQRHVEIRLAEPLPDGIPRISPEIASDWATTLAARNRSDALSLSQRKISELAENLKSAEQRDVDLQSELDSLRSLNQTLELLALVASKTDNAVIILDSEYCVEWVQSYEYIQQNAVSTYPKNSCENHRRHRCAEHE